MYNPVLNKTPPLRMSGNFKVHVMLTVRRSYESKVSTCIFRAPHFYSMPAAISSQTIDLPSSKQLIGEIPGHPQRLNSLPISMAISPDDRYVVTVNAGYGTFESKYEQSLAVLDTKTGALTDFPDSRTVARTSKQTLYSGLAFSRDGKHIYASIASLSNPLGGSQERHRQRHSGV